MLGYGHFVFESAAQEQGLRDIRYVGRPDERDLAIQRVVQRSGPARARGSMVGHRVHGCPHVHGCRLPFDPIDEAARQWGLRWSGRPRDARRHLADAGPAARHRPARRDPQAARADLRPLRGAGAARLLLPRARCRWARWGSGCRCTPRRSPRSCSGSRPPGLVVRRPHPRTAGPCSPRSPTTAGPSSRRPPPTWSTSDFAPRRPRRRRSCGRCPSCCAPVRHAAGDF